MAAPSDLQIVPVRPGQRHAAATLGGGGALEMADCLVHALQDGGRGGPVGERDGR
jgi:hypothetical protein